MLPVGQACLEAGFTVITEEQMFESFSCDRITNEEFEKAKQIIIRMYPKKANRIDRHMWCARVTVWGHKYDEPYKRCMVHYQPIDSYVEEKISEESLQSIRKAQELGIKKIEVAFPVYRRYNSEPCYTRASKKSIAVGVLCEGKKGWDRDSGGCIMIKIAEWGK